MNPNVARSLALVSVLYGSSGCAVVGDIFKAGVWVGVIAIVAMLAVVAGLVSALTPKK